MPRKKPLERRIRRLYISEGWGREITLLLPMGGVRSSPQLPIIGNFGLGIAWMNWVSVVFNYSVIVFSLSKMRQVRSKLIVARVSRIQVQWIETVSRSKFAMLGAKETNFDHCPRAWTTYWKKMPKSRKEGKYERKRLSTIKTQLIETIFYPKFAVGVWVPKTTPLYLEMGASAVENNISSIEHNWDKINSKWFGIKSHNGRLAYPQPSHHIRDSGSAQLSKPNLTFNFGMGRRGLGRHSRLIFFN